ncbi:MAG: polyribonucleotide nucleotidyltransferase [Sandaracinaceae bacterium]|nr:polyribonucleotide nucleotidyltransferase [Sandaracinaceae bacterium]
MIIRESVNIGDKVVTLETGRIAKQASGSVLVTSGESVVLVTVCGADGRPGTNFLPLSVDYQEKTFAAGKIPGGFFKREGRLRNHEVLTSRLIDRPCRPLFPEAWRNEIQIIATVLSHDQENSTDVLSLLGASAALHLSEIPWAGPIGGLRVGRVDGRWVANPTMSETKASDCELIIAASKDAIVMVEGEANELSEEELIEALWFGKEAVQPAIALIEQLREAAGKPKIAFTPPVRDERIDARVRDVALDKIKAACNVAEKAARYGAFRKAKKETVAALEAEFPDQLEAVKEAFGDLQFHTMREQVMAERRRVDGRDLTTVRPINIEVGLLPRVHGSTLFTRGETQAIATATLGTASDEQKLDMLTGTEWVNFMLHYNFPPYSVGEVKFLRGPGRREIGHGNLAERALMRLMPKKEAFPYTVRIVSEITESNGSSSMATVCGGTLAMMDAGVPITAPVAGVAMGLISDGKRHAVLTDILGDEDHLGDMDFKVCGTAKGVTAIQMDIKIAGLSREIMEQALEQAKNARLHILDKMLQAIPAPRAELNKWAPRITSIKVKPDQIRVIIGPGGKMIRAIQEQSGAQIDVEDDGTVNVASPDSAAVAKALELIRGLTEDAEIGKTYRGVVKRVEPYGAFLEIMPNKDGLCHISDFSWEHVGRTEDVMNLGDVVEVQVTDIDDQGRIRLSRKALLPKPEGWEERESERREARGDRGDRGDRGGRGGRGGDRDRDRGRGRDRGGRGDRDRDRGRDRDRRDDRPRDDRPREARPRDDRPRDDRPREDADGEGGRRRRRRRRPEDGSRDENSDQG